MRGSVVKLLRPFVVTMLIGDYTGIRKLKGRRDEFTVCVPGRNRVRYAKRLWKSLPHNKRGIARLLATKHNQSRATHQSNEVLVI